MTPALLQPYPALNFSDQFAFRPSGSTTVDIVAMLHTVRSMLTDLNISSNKSKAFDTVRHASLMNKLAQLAIPDSVYNWVIDFFSRPRPLHQVCRNSICNSYYSRQRYSRISTRASVFVGTGGGPNSF